MQPVLSLPFKWNIEKFWANCLRELFSVGFIGVGGNFAGFFLSHKILARLLCRNVSGIFVV